MNKQAFIVKGYRYDLELALGKYWHQPPEGPPVRLSGASWATPMGTYHPDTISANRLVRAALRGLLDADPPEWIETLRCRYRTTSPEGATDRWFETFDGAMRRVVEVYKRSNGMVTLGVEPRVELLNGMHPKRRVSPLVPRGHKRDKAYFRRLYKYQTERLGKNFKAKRKKAVDNPEKVN